MSQSSRPLGRPDTANHHIPQFRNWTTELRVVNAIDTDKSAIPLNQRINLAKVPGSDGPFSGADGSRYGLNTIVLLAQLTGTSATVNLWIYEAGAYFQVATNTITANAVLTYTNLPPLQYIVEVVGLEGDTPSVTLHGGGTY